MPRITANETQSTMRIFNAVNCLVGSYYGRDKSAADAKQFVSENRWIMFPHLAITSLREGSMMQMPNVFVCFENDIVDNGAGLPVGGVLGLTFNNDGAMEWLNRLLFAHPVFLESLHALGDDWTVRIQHKVKVNFYLSTPLYEDSAIIKTSTAVENEIHAAVAEARRTLPRDFFRDEPIDSAAVVFTVDKLVGPTYEADMRAIFSLLLLALSHR